MNQVFQASPVRSDSYKPWIRALGLLCSLLISSWFPAYNFTFKARGLETFPVNPAPTGSQSSAWLAKLHPQAVALLKKRVWPHETGISKPVFPSAVQIPLHNINLEVRDAGLGLCYSKINVDHIYIIPKAKDVKFIYQCIYFFWIFIIFVISALQKNYRITHIP